jgi:hypothetical protein
MSLLSISRLGRRVKACVVVVAAATAAAFFSLLSSRRLKHAVNKSVAANYKPLKLFQGKPTLALELSESNSEENYFFVGRFHTHTHAKPTRSH